MATHCSVLPWEIPWTEESGKLQSKGSEKVRHDWATKQSCMDLNLIWPGTYKNRRLGYTHKHTQRKDHERYREKAVIYKPKRRASEETNPTDTLILDFQPLVLREEKCLLFQPTSLWYFVMAALTNKYNAQAQACDGNSWLDWMELPWPSIPVWVSLGPFSLVSSWTSDGSDPRSRKTSAPSRFCWLPPLLSRRVLFLSRSTKNHCFVNAESQIRTPETQIHSWVMGLGACTSNKCSQVILRNPIRDISSPLSL